MVRQFSLTVLISVNMVLIRVGCGLWLVSESASAALLQASHDLLLEIGATQSQQVAHLRQRDVNWCMNFVVGRRLLNKPNFKRLKRYDDGRAFVVPTPLQHWFQQ